MIRLLKKNKITLFEDTIPLDFIYKSDEIWLTSSTKEIQPIESIGDYKIPKKNSDLLIWRRILESFDGS